jgi:hemerythrin-like metal-binding protein
VAAAEARDGTGSEKALGLLIEDLAAHCASEEGLMVGPASAQAGEHQASHERLLKEFRDLACQVHRGDAEFTPAIFDRLEDALLNHILLDDRELARQLEPGRP